MILGDYDSVEDGLLDKYKSCLLYTSGRTRQLSVIVRPAVNNDSYEWYSSDTGIVTVDGNGVITTVGPGEAEVYVISDGAGVESSCIVHSLAISRSNITLEQYDSCLLYTSRCV